MKDTEIHNGLPNKEIRDFFAKTIVDIHSIKLIEQTDFPKSNWEYTIAREKNKIKNSEIQIEKAGIGLAVQQLVKMMDWQEFDISDYVNLTGSFWRSFYGTQMEYDNFIAQF